MERQSSRSLPSGAAREQLRAARQAHDGSVRRATTPAGLILALSFFCGVLTVPPANRGPGHLATIIAVIWFVIELLKLSARNQWRALRSLPSPRWDIVELALIAVAVIVGVGGVVGSHLLAGRSNAAAASWGLGAAVAVTVAACLFAANASYRHRTSQAWRR